MWNSDTLVMLLFLNCAADLCSVYPMGHDLSCEGITGELAIFLGDLNIFHSLHDCHFMKFQLQNRGQ